MEEPGSLTLESEAVTYLLMLIEPDINNNYRLVCKWSADIRDCNNEKYP